MAALTKPTTVVWLRDELRVHDNALFAAAAARGGPVLPVYCVSADAARAADSGLARKCGARRAHFTLECVADLKATLEGRGSGLVVKRGAPADVLGEIVAKCGGDATVIYSPAPCPEEAADERAVAALCACEAVAEGPLYHDGDLEAVPFYDGLFTKWKQAVERAKTPVRGDVFPASAVLPAPPGAFAGDLAAAPPTLEALGYDAADAVSDLRGDFFAPVGGETAGLARLERYVNGENRLKDYFETRNGLAGQGYSTKLAPWLARGCVSPRAVARACAAYEKRTGIANKSTYWVVFELTWRDFFLRYAATHGAKLFRAHGVRGDPSKKWTRFGLDRWKSGRTGVALVDAFMIELDKTGFMSNRGRQIVASYLVHDLGIDWRLGAEHFEEHLVDYTPEANWGNWHAVAGLSGGRINRFNVAKQAKDHDADGAFARLWIPELTDVPDVHNAAALARAAPAYPRPLAARGFSYPPSAKKGGPEPRRQAKPGAKSDSKRRKPARRGRVQGGWAGDE